MNYLTLFSSFLIISCSNQTDEIIYQTQNKDNTQKAILAVRPAEWNVGDSYRVYILNSNEKLNNSGVVFIANDWDKVLPRDTSEVNIDWIDNKNLRIVFDKKLHVLNQVVRMRDNVINYDTNSNNKK